MDFTIGHAKQLQEQLKPKTENCRWCKGKGYTIIEIAHEEVRDLHRSGGIYYTTEHRKCRHCKNK